MYLTALSGNCTSYGQVCTSTTGMQACNSIESCVRLMCILSMIPGTTVIAFRKAVGSAFYISDIGYYRAAFYMNETFPSGFLLFAIKNVTDEGYRRSGAVSSCYGVNCFRAIKESSSWDIGVPVWPTWKCLL